MNGLVTAFRTLTILPVPGRDADDFSKALPHFPLVGAAIGIVAALAAWVISDGMAWPLGGGVAVVAVTAFLTRGIHLDGLGDAFDALGGGRTPARRLEIMKDPHIGSFGVVAIVTCLMIKAAAVAQISTASQHLAVVVPFVVSRAIQVELAAALPYARREGGTARAFVEGAEASHFLLATLFALLLCYLFGGFCGLIVLLAAYAASPALMWWLRREFGGVTGDLLGMASEVTETLLLAGLAMVGHTLSGIQLGSFPW